MNIFKRVRLSLVNRKGKTLILMLIIFLIGNVIAGAVSINNASRQVEKSIKMQLGATASIDINFGDGMSSTIPEPIPLKVIEEISNLDEVKSAKYDLSVQLASDKYENYKAENQDMEFSGGITMSPSIGMVDSLNVRGYANQVDQELIDEKIIISEGEYPVDNGDISEIMISEEYAKLNGLKVGDEIILSSYVTEFSESTNKSYPNYFADHTYKISGVFKVTPQISNDPMQAFGEELQHNTAYVTFDSVYALDLIKAKKMFEAGYDFCQTETACLGMLMPKFELSSVDDIDSFVEKSSLLLDLDKYEISTSKDTYNQVAGSVENMKDMSDAVLFFGTIAAVVILSLVLFLFTRDRKHEFGIYQALGESRLKSSLQLVMEVFIVAIISVSFALLSGNVLAKNISTKMINQQISQQEQNMSNMMGGISFIPSGGINGGLSETQVMENFKIEMSSDYVISFYSIMLLSSTGAALIASVYIMRLKPREILL